MTQASAGVSTSSSVSSKASAQGFSSSTFSMELYQIFSHSARFLGSLVFTDLVNKMMIIDILTCMPCSWRYGYAWPPSCAPCACPHPWPRACTPYTPPRLVFWIVNRRLPFQSENMIYLEQDALEAVFKLKISLHIQYLTNPLQVRINSSPQSTQAGQNWLQGWNCFPKSGQTLL